jgi:hypothetical protein
MTSWPVALAERLMQLESMGADKALAAQARAQMKRGNLIEAEELISTIELRRMAWMRPR